MTISGVPRVAWLFTREQKSLRLEVRTGDDQVSLLIFGPGSNRASHVFPDLLTLLDYQAAYEQQLAAAGWMLDQFIAERRRWPR